MHILSPETDNCPSWISGRERMTVENISWSISMKEWCRPRRGLNPRPPDSSRTAHPTEPLRPIEHVWPMSKSSWISMTNVQIILHICYGCPAHHVPLLALNCHITKTCLYNFDPLKPHFYIVKLGYTGVYIIFLISAQNIDCGYSLEPPRGGSNEYPQSMFWAEIWKIIKKFYLKIFIFWW